MADHDGYLTVPDFLQTYAISRTGFYRTVNAGKLRLTKIGRSSRVALSEARRWAAALPTVGGGAV